MAVISRPVENLDRALGKWKKGEPKNHFIASGTPLRFGVRATSPTCHPICGRAHKDVKFDSKTMWRLDYVTSFQIQLLVANSSVKTTCFQLHLALN